MIQSLQSENDSLEGILPSIGSFVSESTLKGKAWTGVKNQLNGHQVVIRGLICANEQTIADCNTLAGAVGSEDLDEDELKEKIASRQKENVLFGQIKQNNLNSKNNLSTKMPINSYTSLSTYYTNQISSMNNLINTNNEYIAELEAKLVTLEQIEAATKGLFLSATSVTVGDGIEALGGSWTGSGFSLPASTPWMKDLSKEWKKRQELGKATPEEQKKLDELGKEAKTVLNKAEEDYLNGLIDLDTLKSLRTGFITGAISLTTEILKSAVTDEYAKVLADSAISWLQQNTPFFMDRGLAAVTVNGMNVVLSEAPDFLAKTIRSGAKYGAPIIGGAIDFIWQVAEGENCVDAGVKTAGHLAASAVGAKVGMAIGSAIPGAGTVVGAVVGAGLGMAFDYVYDNRSKIADGISNLSNKVKNTAKKAADNIGNAVSGFFNGLGSAFG